MISQSNKWLWWDYYKKGTSVYFPSPCARFLFPLLCRNLPLLQLHRLTRLKIYFVQMAYCWFSSILPIPEICEICAPCLAGLKQRQMNKDLYLGVWVPVPWRDTFSWAQLKMFWRLLQVVKFPFSSALLDGRQDFTDERWRKPYASVMKREVKELQVLNTQELDHRITES